MKQLFKKLSYFSIMFGLISVTMTSCTDEYAEDVELYEDASHARPLTGIDMDSSSKPRQYRPIPKIHQRMENNRVEQKQSI